MFPVLSLSFQLLLTFGEGDSVQELQIPALNKINLPFTQCKMSCQELGIEATATCL